MPCLAWESAPVGVKLYRSWLPCVQRSGTSGEIRACHPRAVWASHRSVHFMGRAATGAACGAQWASLSGPWDWGLWLMTCPFPESPCCAGPPGPHPKVIVMSPVLMLRNQPSCHPVQDTGSSILIDDTAFGPRWIWLHHTVMLLK